MIKKLMNENSEQKQKIKILTDEIFNLKNS